MFSKTCATKTYRRSRKHHINECETRPWLWSGSDVIEGTVSTWAPTKGQSLFLHPQKQGHLEKEKKKNKHFSGSSEAFKWTTDAAAISAEDSYPQRGVYRV